MDKAHREILRSNRLQLAKDLLRDELVQILVGGKILTDDMVERINSKTTEFDKNVALLNILPRRGPDAFAEFVAALVSTDQEHLVQLLQCNSRGSSVTQPRNPSASSFNLDSPSAFNFTSPPPSGCKRSLGQFELKRYPTEHHDSSHHEEPSCSKTKYARQGHGDAAEKMDVIPSPCNSLSDLESTTSFDILYGEAELLQNSLSAAAKPSREQNTVINPFLADPEKRARDFLTSCDLADGPSFGDMEVRRSTPQFRSLHQIDSYTVTQGFKGLALIISIDNFEPSACLDNRLGSNVDRSRLEIVLRQLGFRVYILIDGTKQEVWDTLVKFASLDEHDMLDCSMVAVMSHGNDGVFYGRDGLPVYIDEMLNLFNNVNCPGLQNKPKVFLFQSCRGDKPDKGVDEIDSPAKPSAPQIPQSDLRTNPRFGLRTNLAPPAIRNKVPTVSDTLVGFATVRGYTAMRNTKHGSWFIQAFVRVLAYHSCDKHLLEMMTIVNNIIKSKEGHCPSSEFHRCKEMSEFKSSLCKNLYFFPGV